MSIASPEGERPASKRLVSMDAWGWSSCVVFVAG
jgi:hypothetical protein